MSHILHILFWAAVLFLTLSFFGITIRSIVDSPAGQANLAYLTYLAISAWHWLAAYATQARGQLPAL